MNFYKINNFGRFLKRITLIVFFLIFVSCLSLYAWQYINQRNTYYYTIEFPDDGGWDVVDDSKMYNALFQNGNKDAYAEVTVYDLVSAESNQELFDSFVRRFQMKGKASNATFCKYSAVRGEYTFNFSNLDLKIDMVVFKDNYFFYVVMGYCHNNKYESYKDMLYKIVNSCKIYYDNDVVYANDVIEEDYKDDGQNIKQSLDVEEEDDDTAYTVHIKYDQATEIFKFFEADLAKAIKEIDEIGTFDSSGYWKGWKYFNIDFNDPDYEFNFWKNFYQEMYNKNYYRVKHMYNHFKDKENSVSSWELANLVMKSIQVIPYKRPRDISDKNLGSGILDFFSPNQVAKTNNGDCDTKSLFMVILLRRLGFDALMYHSAKYSHAMVGININASGTYKTFNGKKYYFIESTYPGWKIGDIPPNMNDTTKWNIIPIK